MQTPTQTEPRELARQARLLLAAAKALKQLTQEVTAPELLTKERTHDDQAEWVKWCNYSIDAMLKEAITARGLKVALFPENEQEGK